MEGVEKGKDRARLGLHPGSQAQDSPDSHMGHRQPGLGGVLPTSRLKATSSWQGACGLWLQPGWEAGKTGAGGGWGH